MKIERTADKLIIRETPGCLWILALFFAVIGSVFVYGALGGYTNYNEASALVLGLHLFGGLCAIAAGYWIVYIAPMTKVTIDRSAETVTHKKRGISSKSDVTYRFNEIKHFLLIEEPDFDNDFVWSLGMELADGEMIRISSVHSTVESFKRDFVFQANEFMYKQVPSYQDGNALEGEN